MEPLTASIWPLFDLRVSTPRLTLRYITDELGVQLAELAALGIHEPETMPFSEPWTDVAPPELQRNSLRYFWQERSPEETAADLARIIAAYTAQWKVPNVLLLGYSFGADVLAATYDRLPPEARAKVRQISLLGLSDHAAWEISVSGWLGQESDGPETGPDIARIEPALLQCFYGAEEEATSPCPALAARGAEVFRTAGGHHFDGNYQALAQDVLTGLDRRLGR